MSRLTAILLLSFLSGLVPAQVTSPTELPKRTPDYESGIAAKVNREVITRAEVWRAIQTKLPALKTDAEKERAFEIARVQLVQKMILEQAVKRAGVRVDEERIRRAVIDEESERLGGSAGFQTMLAERGQSEREYVDGVVDQVEQNNVMRVLSGVSGPLGKRLRPEFVAEPRADEIREYYRNNEAEFTRPPRALVQYVVLRRSQFENRWRKTLDEALRLKKELETGADLEALATGLEGTQTGAAPAWVSPGKEQSLPEEVEAFAFSAKAGQVSEPIQFPRGYFLVFLKDLRAAEKIPFRDAQAEITMKLKEVRRERARALIYRKFLNESYIWPPKVKEILRGE